MSTTTTAAAIDDLTVDLGECYSIAWHGSTDLPCPDGGTDYGRLMVRFGVDGQFDIVYGELDTSGDLESIDRAIEVLTTMRERLSAAYGDRPRDTGQCLVVGRAVTDVRCERRGGHGGRHRFEKCR